MLTPGLWSNCGSISFEKSDLTTISFKLIDLIVFERVMSIFELFVCLTKSSIMIIIIIKETTALRFKKNNFVSKNYVHLQYSLVWKSIPWRFQMDNLFFLTSWNEVCNDAWSFFNGNQCGLILNPINMDECQVYYKTWIIILNGCCQSDDL